jgi:uncharacterized protein YtpQ (UPF0354 family)
MNQQQFMEQWNEIYKMKKEKAEKECKMKDKILAKEQNLRDEIIKGMVEKDKENILLKKENLALKMKMTKIMALLKAVSF